MPLLYIYMLVAVVVQVFNTGEKNRMCVKWCGETAIQSWSTFRRTSALAEEVVGIPHLREIEFAKLRQWWKLQALELVLKLILQCITKGVGSEHMLKR